MALNNSYFLVITIKSITLNEPSNITRPAGTKIPYDVGGMYDFKEYIKGQGEVDHAQVPSQGTEITGLKDIGVKKVMFYDDIILCLIEPGPGFLFNPHDTDENKTAIIATVVKALFQDRVQDFRFGWMMEKLADDDIPVESNLEPEIKEVDGSSGGANIGGGGRDGS